MMSPVKTTVVNIKKEKCDVYIGRGSIFGNPYEIGKDGTREEVIERYRIWFGHLLKSSWFRDTLDSMRGAVLGCYCKPKKCHGTVILKYFADCNDGKMIDEFTA